MIVLDASVVVELLTQGAPADSVRKELSGQSGPLLVPHLLDVEVTSALRNLVAGRQLDAPRAAELLSVLVGLPVERVAHVHLLNRIWELRHNFTAYDAAYIALAEATGSVLYTCDAKQCKGHRARVVLFS